MISVIIPVYKVEQYLDRCLESVTGQTYRDLEIILVDDGSPDHCPEMCEAWAEKDSRIKVIHKQNGGLSDARNVGLHVASGEYISFVDSDDLIASDMLETLYCGCQSMNCQICACRFQRFSDEYELIHNKFCQSDKHLSERLSTEEALEALIKNKKLQQVVWNKLYCRDVINGILFEVGRQHEDSFWTYQIIGNAETIAVIDYIGYYYRQRSDSIIGTGFGMKNLDAIEARINRLNYISDRFPKLEAIATNELQGMCIYCCQKTLKTNTLSKEDKKKMISYLRKVLDFSKQNDDPSLIPIKQRIWRRMAKVSFVGTCRLRNLLCIGV